MKLLKPGAQEVSMKQRARDEVILRHQDTAGPYQGLQKTSSAAVIIVLLPVTCNHPSSSIIAAIT